jgi:hypothetical protein
MLHPASVQALSLKLEGLGSVPAVKESWKVFENITAVGSPGLLVSRVVVAAEGSHAEVLAAESTDWTQA